jgi:hypothetical protein
MGCHGGMRPAGNLDLSSATTARAALVNVGADGCIGTAKIRVVPGDPAASYLIAKLTGVGMCSGSVMPKMGSELTAAQLDVIRAWIGSGAAP